MTTPTREELAAMIDPYWDDDLYRLKRVADVVLPLLRERDDKIVSLDTSVASLEATIAEKDARIAKLEAESRSWAVAVAGRNASAVPPTIDLASSREYACSDNCKNVYQAHYDKHEPNCQGEEILELCDEIERLRAFISSGALGVQVAERIDKLVAERDAALADRAGNELAKVQAEREAPIAVHGGWITYPDGEGSVDPLEGANCHLCGRPADTFWVSDDLWRRVGLDGQVCFRCFRVAAWHVGIRPESNWFVSLSDVESERDQALADSKVFEQSMWELVAERDAALARVAELEREADELYGWHDG